MKYSTIYSCATLMTLLSMCGGCATIFGGARDQEIHVNSTPSGANVTVNGESKGSTPLKLYLNRKSNYDIVVEKSGFEPEQVTLKPGLNGWVFGNILFGGIIGIVVDLAADSTSALYPGGVNAQLKTNGMASGTPPYRSSPSSYTPSHAEPPRESDEDFYRHELEKTRRSLNRS